jgi:HTH-type transcriptional regulator / antitoxin HigA
MTVIDEFVAARGTGAEASKDYLDLVRLFPLRPLRTTSDFRSAGRILDRLIGRDDLTPGQRDYLAALVRFVQDYEQQHARQWMKGLGPIELLKHLMEENGLSTSDLGQILGSRGLASEVLRGKRGLSKALIARLAARFRVEPGLFL